MAMPVFNSRDAFYKSAFGAVSAGTEITFTLLVPNSFSAQYVGLLIARDGCKDFDVAMQYVGEQNGSSIYRGSYCFDEVGVVWYGFKISTASGDRFVKRDHDGFGTIAGDCFEKFQQTVYDPDFKTPDGFKGGTWYQIFPDRFYASGAEKQNVPADRLVRSDWGGMPYFLPNEQGKVTNNDYFGGDFLGIALKLPYLKKLGVTAIYLNPIFEAHSNHRYNTANYMKTDPLLGTNEEFKALCAQAHRNGIKIILDGVFSHTGSDSVYFNQNRRYDSVGAYNSPDSPYSSWYKFYDYPDGYHSWWGFKTLPETNEEDESYAEFICGENGVVRTWLRAGADGFRLDVADELPDSMIDRLRTAVKAEGEDKILIGEVWEDASNKESYGARRRYLLGAQLDAVMNYPFKDAILDYVRSADKAHFIERIMTIVEHYPKQALDVMMNSLSTHDTERAITRLAGESVEGHDRMWQSHHTLSIDDYKLGKKRLMLAMVLQYFLPGIPCVYYGDEAGMQGYKDPFNRGCYPWGHEDTDLIAHAQKLGALRAACSCVAEGAFRFLPTEGELIAFERADAKDSVTVIVNPTDRDALYADKTIPAYGYEILTGKKPSKAKGKS